MVFLDQRFGFVAALLAILLAGGTALAQKPAAASDEMSDEEFLAGGPVAEPVSEHEPADPAAETIEAETDEEETHDRDHYFQGFANVLFGTGWYMVAPYEKNDPDKACEMKPSDNPNTPDGEGEPICSGRSGMHLDILAGFAPIAGFEVFVMTRVGVEGPVQGRPNPRWIGAGVKKYTPSAGLFKVAIGIAPLFDFSEHDVDLGYDFVIHIPIAAHFDIVKWFGAYLQAAPNISFVTEFRLDISFGVGVQGRFP